MVINTSALCVIVLVFVLVFVRTLYSDRLLSWPWLCGCPIIIFGVFVVVVVGVVVVVYA